MRLDNEGRECLSLKSRVSRKLTDFGGPMLLQKEFKKASTQSKT